VAEDTGNAEITHLYYVVFCHKHVLALDVTMENFAVMYMLHSKTDLSEPVENQIFVEVSAALLLYFLG
jgi:hypothetical protein